MIIVIQEIKQPIFEERLDNSAILDGFPSSQLKLVVYQLQSRTLFSHSVYNKVSSAYFDEATGREISRKHWTAEMATHAQMRESTVPRVPKKVRYTLWGKALMILLALLLVGVGYFVLKRATTVYDESVQEATLNTTPKAGDQYYGYLTEFTSTGVAKSMGWTWLKIVKAENGTYIGIVDDKISQSPVNDSQPGAFNETQSYKLLLKPGAKPSFSTADHGFKFVAMRKR